MDEKVTPIHEARREPNHTVMTFARSLYERAERGEVTDLFAIAVIPGVGFLEGLFLSEVARDHIQMIGHIEVKKQVLVDRIKTLSTPVTRG